jgi:hypothetical protein
MVTTRDDVLRAAGLRPEDADKNEQAIAVRICSEIPEGPRRKRAVKAFRELCGADGTGEAIGCCIELERLLGAAQGLAAEGRRRRGRGRGRLGTGRR